MSDSTPTLERRVADALISELYRQGIALDEFSPPINSSALARAALDASGNDELVATFEPFVPVYESWMDEWPDDAQMSVARLGTYGQLRKARAAIARTQEQSDG